MIAVAAVCGCLAITGCAESAPRGTLTEGDLPEPARVVDVLLDVQGGQTSCSAVNNAEDDEVMTPSPNYDRDRHAAVSYKLAGDGGEWVSDSVWRLSSPDAAVAKVATGLDACVAEHPDHYARFTVTGHPEAVGYTAVEHEPTHVYTRRILAPLDDRVVIVSAQREGDDDFMVPPESILDRAIERSGDAPR